MGIVYGFKKKDGQTNIEHSGGVSESENLFILFMA